MTRNRLLGFGLSALLLAASCRKQHPLDAEYPLIPAGSFMRGSVYVWPKDRPMPQLHEEAVKEFRIGATEVTVASFEKFCAATKRDMPRSVSVNTGWRNKDAPMVWVSADDAREYCAWAGGRLPTESEWEYAARGGLDGMIFPWGDEVSHENANYGSQKWGQPGHAEGRDKWIGPSPVRSFPPNGYGLFDMSGNVWEWVELDSRYNPPPVPLEQQYYRNLPPDSAAVRGGSFGSQASLLTVSTRQSSKGERRVTTGFRCAKDIAP